MADDEKKTEPPKLIAHEILRKMALAGKSLPSVRRDLPPEEKAE